tara:strand:+ start:323 stop:1159 length:837 start_codon:yes stop_codon:yes gene_type:complete
MDSSKPSEEEVASHESKMVEKANAESAPGEKQSFSQAEHAVPERPENIPEKFWNAEKGELRLDEFVKSYSELERQRSQKAEEPNPDAQKQGDDGENSEETKESSSEVAPFEEIRSAAEAEFEANGSLSDQTYEVLEKQGFSKAMVDQYIAGAQAQTQAAVGLVMDNAGTTLEEYQSATAWAAENLSEKEIETFNNALASDEAAPLVVKDLVSRYRKEADVEPGTTVSGSGSTAAGHYRSRAEMVADMSDPKYKTDTAFMQKVAQKIAAAELAGVNLFQ